MPFVTVTLQRTLARAAHLHLPPPPQTTWPPWRAPPAGPRSTPSSSTASPPRRSYCASHTPSPSLGNAPVAHGLPISRRRRPRRRACRERATRRIDGARRARRFVARFCARSARLRPRPSQTRRVTHGAVGRSSVARHPRSFRRAAKRRANSFLFRPLKIPLITTRWTDEKHPKT